MANVLLLFNLIFNSLTLTIQYYESARYYSNQKDLLINQLKSEIFELKGKAKDYNTMRDKIVEMEMAYRRLLEEKVISNILTNIQGNYEDNLRGKIDNSYQDSQSLKKDIDELRSHITLKYCYLTVTINLIGLNLMLNWQLKSQNRKQLFKGEKKN